MENDLIRTYHIAPNFRIPPPEAGGLLGLGSIIAGRASAADPINEDCRERIPNDRLHCAHAESFKATLSALSSGQYGVTAKVLASGVVGGKVSTSSEVSSEDVLSCEALDVIEFNPKKIPGYIEKMMGYIDVKDYIRSERKPVYMVTGLQIVRSPSLTATAGKKRTIEAEGNLTEPNTSLDIGARIATENRITTGTEFEASTDFIFGIRLIKLVYKKQWWQWWGKGTLKVTDEIEGAKLLDGDGAGEDEVLDLGGDVALDADGKLPEGVELVDMGEDEGGRMAWVTSYDSVEMPE
ncbi:hypothetical protein F5X68DRAFT_11914 [Plectosphaerella plurivora]|uniref:Uncharacterized protein n=1 Tax=Plectosphaerella plurivora TaxID=936078 RepID=A0A9P8VCU1_9PEZI|nr:hypothetical protein F5X68DRAFT_11914 [Plectosphaerella plurivora]